MASNRPIIASDLPAVREILNEKNAIFFNPDDDDDLAKKINFVLDNYKSFEKSAARARYEVEEYSWNNRADLVMKFFQRGIRAN